MAHIKTDTNINNHLIIVFRGKKSNILFDENLENYFQKYVFLEHVEEDEANEEEFWRRLIAALKSKRLVNGALDFMREEDYVEEEPIAISHDIIILWKCGF